MLWYHSLDRYPYPKWQSEIQMASFVLLKSFIKTGIVLLSQKQTNKQTKKPDDVKS